MREPVPVSGTRVTLVVAVMALAVSGAAAPAAGRTAGSDATGEPIWTRHGTGDVAGLLTADLDGDGTGEVMVAGRGVGTVGEPSLETGRFRWAQKWGRRR